MTFSSPNRRNYARICDRRDTWRRNAATLRARHPISPRKIATARRFSIIERCPGQRSACHQLGYRRENEIARDIFSMAMPELIIAVCSSGNLLGAASTMPCMFHDAPGMIIERHSWAQARVNPFHPVINSTLRSDSLDSDAKSSPIPLNLFYKIRVPGRVRCSADCWQLRVRLILTRLVSWFV